MDNGPSEGWYEASEHYSPQIERLERLNAHLKKRLIAIARPCTKFLKNVKALRAALGSNDAEVQILDEIEEALRAVE